MLKEAIAALPDGEHFQIEGVFSLNPDTLDPTPWHARFVKTVDSYWPIPMTSGKYRNVSAIPRDDARIFTRFEILENDRISAGKVLEKISHD